MTKTPVEETNGFAGFCGAQVFARLLILQRHAFFGCELDERDAFASAFQALSTTGFFEERKLGRVSDLTW